MTPIANRLLIIHHPYLSTESSIIVLVKVGSKPQEKPNNKRSLNLGVICSYFCHILLSERFLLNSKIDFEEKVELLPRGEIAN